MLFERFQAPVPVVWKSFTGYSFSTPLARRRSPGRRQRDVHLSDGRRPGWATGCLALAGSQNNIKLQRKRPCPPGANSATERSAGSAGPLRFRWPATRVSRSVVGGHAEMFMVHVHTCLSVLVGALLVNKTLSCRLLKETLALLANRHLEV